MAKKVKKKSSKREENESEEHENEEVSSDGTLDPEAADHVQVDSDKPVVKTAIKLIEENWSAKNSRDQKNEKVIKAAEECFEAKDPDGIDKISSKEFIQAFWKVMSRMKPLDYAIHGVGAEQWQEKIVYEGIETILRRGGFYRSLMTKGGALSNASAIGDGFMLFSTKKKGFPFKFTPIPNNNVYVNTESTGMRVGAKPVRRCAVIIPRTISEFNQIWPNWEDKVGPGKIPRKINLLGDIDQDSFQKLDKDDRKVIEEMHYFDLDNRVYAVIAGAGCTVIKDLRDNKYPFSFKNQETQDKEDFIPLLSFMGIPAFKGFYNNGIFHWLYDSAMLAKQTFNKVASSISDNLDPIHVLSVPKGRGAEMFGQIEAATRARANGKKPIVALEYDPQNPGGNGISLNSLATSTDVNAATFIKDYLDRETKRMGIHYDELERDGNVTATQILSEEENATMFVKQILEYNSPEFEFLLNVVLDLIPKTVTPNKTRTTKDPKTGKNKYLIKEGDKTPIYMTTNIKVNGQVIPMKSITLGMLAEELKLRQYFPKVNSRSGAIAPKMRAAQINRALQLAQPGSKAYNELVSEFSANNDIDLMGEDYAGQAAPQAQAGGLADQTAEPNATERQTINPRQSEQEPII